MGRIMAFRGPQEEKSLAGHAKGPFLHTEISFSPAQTHGAAPSFSRSAAHLPSSLRGIWVLACPVAHRFRVSKKPGRPDMPGNAFQARCGRPDARRKAFQDAFGRHRAC